MPQQGPPSLRCPTCRTIIAASDEHFPFCSDRCRLIDLGKWASGGYVISSQVTDPEILEDLAEESAKHGSPTNDDPSIHKH